LAERYKRPFAPEATLDEDEENVLLNNTNPPKTPEDETWKKRYGDLRSHSQKQINELTSRLAALETQLKSSVKDNFELPSTPEEVEEWTRRYPKVAAVIETLAIQKYKSLNESVEERLKSITERETENAVERATLELKKIHPDFDDLKNNSDFHDWLANKSVRTQDTIYKNETDYLAAAETLSLFKFETNYGRAKPNRRAEAKDSAREVATSRTRTPSNSLEPVFTESQIMAMNGKEFEANAEAIEKAQREGRIEMDITNSREAARG